MKNVAMAPDGVSIHYEVHGEGTPALVFVHGWSCDRTYWVNQTSHFAQQYTVVTIDLAGHGESGLDRQAWTMEAFGADVVAVVEALDLEQVVLVGHSMGGTVIVEAARLMPQRVAGLVVVETFKNLAQTRTQEAVDEILAPFRANFQDGTRQFVRSNQFTPASDPAFVEPIVEDMAAAPPKIAIAAADKLFGHDAKLQESLLAIEAPIVLINGDYRPTDREAAARYGIKVEIMSGVSHFLMAEDSARFNRLFAEVVAEFTVQGSSDK